MSGDTVTGEGLQFTNDNKHVYANSGTIAVSGSDTTMLQFETTSSYIVGQLNFTGVWADLGSAAVFMTLLINDTIIFQNKVASASVRDVEGTPYPILLPPNSRIKIQMSQASGSDRNYQAMIIGKVGMPQRVGNLDE